MQNLLSAIWMLKQLKAAQPEFTLKMVYILSDVQLPYL